MTCKEFIANLDSNKDLRDCTVAELAVAARHYRGCSSCRNEVRLRAVRMALTTDKDSLERSKKIGEEAAIRCIKDPEALEVIYGE